MSGTAWEARNAERQQGRRSDPEGPRGGGKRAAGEILCIMRNAAAVRDPREVSQISPRELKDEKDTLTVALTRLQGLILEIPWADWQPIYNQIGKRLEAVRAEVSKRSGLT